MGSRAPIEAHPFCKKGLCGLPERSGGVRGGCVARRRSGSARDGACAARMSCVDPYSTDAGALPESLAHGLCQHAQFLCR